MMTADQVLAAFEGIRRAQRAGVYAPHKPLLMLWALGRAQQGQARLAPFGEVDQPLQDLLAEQTAQPLRILGTDQDTVQVKGEAVEASIVEHDGASYHAYDLDRNGSLDLLVQQQVLVSFHH